jgi:hypothetical protein
MSKAINRDDKEISVFSHQEISHFRAFWFVLLRGIPGVLEAIEGLDGGGR